ncbi:hypothetical protein [Chelatococcus asaccharovorans]|uniref:Uncharacterized protein n=1 Tax=Chelatococcus asaccharovorans TaxID=28210 RepID=A0A2V3UNA2_9HYPH|nr:hypothetical protein [Chelatococcus asaccharovorans]MBS7703278.1 hypothetical protein [Chelatococcus asaccharovorans]PXW61610.1 hypothetical protein C7450_103127 [Chelatococcus asaccharovorans]
MILPTSLAAFCVTHPLLSETATLALMRRSPEPEDWRSLLRGRRPPVRFVHEKATCPLCRQPTYDMGAWWPVAGPATHNRFWHACCVQTWRNWTAYSDLGGYLSARQNWKCAISGEPLQIIRERQIDQPDGTTEMMATRYATRIEIDHRIPLWQVRAEAESHRWPDILRYWGPSNLQVLLPAMHVAKTKQEAADRARARVAA